MNILKGIYSVKLTAKQFFIVNVEYRLEVKRVCHIYALSYLLIFFYRTSSNKSSNLLSQKINNTFNIATSGYK